MTVHIEGFREAHERIRDQAVRLRVAAATLPTLTAHEAAEVRDELLDFLRESVEPHTKLDEQLLFPEVAGRLGDPLVAASMNYDHLAIRYWIEEISVADVADVARLQALLYGLDALIRVHIWKENELFLGVLESAAWPAARPAGESVKLLAI